MASAGGDWKDMYYAAERGDVACVSYHLDAGVDVNYQHPEAMVSALVVAISQGQTAVVDVLLAHGANPNLAAELGALTPLQAAQQQGCPDMVALLLRYGAQALPRQPASWWRRWLPGL